MQNFCIFSFLGELAGKMVQDFVKFLQAEGQKEPHLGGGEAKIRIRI